MLLLGHILCLNNIAGFILTAHIKLRDLNQLLATSQNVQHVHNSLFISLLLVGIHAAGYVHLTTDTINLGHAVSLPTLNPSNQTLGLVVLIPSSLKVIVVDEELHILWTILASQLNGSTNIVDIAQIILPEEALGCSLFRIFLILQVLQSIYALSIGMSA